MDYTKYHIRYWCDLDPGTGYNNAARGYLEAFRRLGLGPDHIHLAPAVFSGFGSIPEDVFDWTQPYTHRASADDVVAAVEAGQPPPPIWDDSRAQINIAHLSPGLLAARDFCTRAGGRYNIAITAWETDGLPTRVAHRDDGRTLSVADALNEYDEVWVPSAWNAAMFEVAGVASTRLHVVRHALLDELATVARDFTPWPARPFTFYSVGTWNARKDPRTVLQAYFLTGWNAASPVDLQLYCVPPTREPRVMWAHQERAQQEREGLLEGLADPLGAPPHGLHTSRYVPYAEVIARHRRGGVLVSASHGEAFGLPLLEALALGRGVIGGGPWVEEFAAVAGRVEDGGLVEVLPTRKVPVTAMAEAAGYEVGQRWWSIDVEDLCAAMVGCVAAERERGAASTWVEEQRAADRVRAHYGTQAVAAVLAERLEVIHKVLDGTGW